MPDLRCSEYAADGKGQPGSLMGIGILELLSFEE
jgi:hypothetical protein